MHRNILATVLLGSLSLGICAAQESAKELEAILAQKPGDSATLVKLGRLYNNQGAAGNQDAVEKGFTYLDNALKLDPSNA